MTDFGASWTDAGGAAHTTHLTLSDDHAVNPSLPIAVLLHGLGGDLSHMADPAQIAGGLNFDLQAPLDPPSIDRGWHSYPNAGFWSVSLDPKKTVKSWQQRLNDAGFATLNYAQVDPWGLLARPVVEADAVVRATLARFGKRVVFLCHSRGGLLLRLLLQRNRGDVAFLRQIAGAVMLHTPNQGSQVADVATILRDAIASLLSTAGMGPAAPVLNWIVGTLAAPGIAELSPGSGTLAALRQQEATPLPVSIPIHTFGGTNPRLARLRFSVFDAMSAVPQWHWPPFHWRTNQVALGLLDGTAASGVCPEERSGGDVLTTDARSHLPGEASHRSNPANHAAALWGEGGIADQVMPILSGFR